MAFGGVIIFAKFDNPERKSQETKKQGWNRADLGLLSLTIVASLLSASWRKHLDKC